MRGRGKLALLLMNVGLMNRVTVGSLQHRPLLLKQRQQCLRLNKLLLVASRQGLDEVCLQRLAAVAAAMLLIATTTYCGAAIRHAGDEVDGSRFRRLGSELRFDTSTKWPYATTTSRAEGI